MIEVDQLSKAYGSTLAIKDVSFKVEPGEILGFLGPNGAGKTTTMRILAGYLPATSGTARIADHEVHTDSMAVRQSIGYLPETPPLYPDMTVEAFLYFVARIKGVPIGDRSQRVASAMERCNLGEKRRILIRKLSKGFRQRVGIAQAIVHDPPVIILDEPTVGLDPKQIIDVRNLIKSLAGQHTIILSTHILPEVSMTCDRITIINQGRIVATDTPENLTARLAGQLGYAIEVAGDPERANSVLNDLEQVESVTALSGEGLAENHYRFQLVSATEDDPGSEIASAIINSDLGLYELSRNRVSLEDVFINLITEDPSTAEEDDSETEPCEAVVDDDPENDDPTKAEAEPDDEAALVAAAEPPTDSAADPADQTPEDSAEQDTPAKTDE
ncbi:ABC transporter ATP-binding protein [Leptothoe kymatousa]|uniref:ABC transporter ATP-binding protein n=1 Tax=Leptothoe kymatousa TAU-MAC 1615 TaxID=2364775 RepID=A0ABS5XZV5_9CYAN|nr:ABC transporter ATP-binding protein [Leptothoe kymatousa]MBT9311134.1 ABC transporter ATP-binding protein [Leptothoe kymatousa TAU-MAC 1615]